MKFEITVGIGENAVYVYVPISGQKNFTPLQDNNILALSKLTAFADDNSDGTQNIELVFHRVENIMEKGENRRKCCYKHFLLFP